MILRLRADAARIPLADGSVHLCVTSPSYYGLRVYEGSAQVREWADGTRHALGNEPTVDLYVAHLVECFREVRRVLRDDGVCWVVLGDSFVANAATGDRAHGFKRRAGLSDGSDAPAQAANAVGGRASGLIGGNLLGAPWRVALALQADGWVLRNDVVWAKRAAMPESVSGWRWQRCRVKVREGGCGDGKAMRRDPARGDNRPTEWADCSGCATCAPNDGLVLRRGSGRPVRAHEVVLMLVKKMAYYYDVDAVRHKGLYGLREAEAAGTVLRQQCGGEAGWENGALRGMLPREGAMLSGVSTGAGCDPALAEEADQVRQARRSASRVEADAIWARGDAPLREVGEGLGGESALPAVRGRQEDDHSQPQAVFRGKPGTLPRVLAEEEQGAGLLRSPGTVGSDKEGTGDAPAHPQALQVWSDGAGSSAPERDQAAQPDARGGLHDDGWSVGADQARCQGSLFLLRTDRSSTDSGSPAILGEGRPPHAGEHRTRMPELQQSEGNEEPLALLRDVFILGPEPLAAAHYASFPSTLVEPLILASTSARGVCRACGAPWARIVERSGTTSRDKLAERGASDYASGQPVSAQGLDYAGGHGSNARRSRTLGWRATCARDASDPVPATILDCFAGTGTVGAVAVRHRRRAILLDLSQTYLRDIADARTRGVQVELPL